MPTTYVHTCYHILDPVRSEDFYVNKLGLKKVGEMDLGPATNLFFALEEDPSQPMLELRHNHDRTEPYDKGDGYAHVAFTVDDLETTIAELKDQDVTVTLEPTTLTFGGNDYRAALIEDPDGYEIEFFQRGTLKIGGMYQ